MDMETKKEIRKRILEQRDALAVEEVNAKSTAIFERLYSLSQYGNAKVILAYMDYRNEVMTGEFIKRCMRDGKRVALPKVEPGNALSIYEISGIERDTSAGFKGIQEPDGAVLNRLDPVEIDMAVIPGVAFDLCRNRIGYGAGYYDRLLPSLRSDCTKAGVAYGFQLVDTIPTGRFDIHMDIIITENGIIS